MKKLTALFCLLPAMANAQGILNEHSRGTSSFVTDGAPTSLVRLRVGQDCHHYPGSRNKANVGGVVKLTYVVGADGSVSSVTVTGSSGDIQLDRGASDCVKSWKFVSPQSFGVPSVSGRATAEYSSDDKGNHRAGYTHWDAPGLRNASEIAVSDLTQQAIKCLQETSGAPALAVGSEGPTTYRLTYFRGEISKILVEASGGSDTLDKDGVTCLMAIPKNSQRAEYLDGIESSELTFPWHKLYTQTAAH